MPQKGSNQSLRAPRQEVGLQWIELDRAIGFPLEAAEADKNIRGVIFQSTLKKHLRPTVAAVLSLLFIVLLLIVTNPGSAR